MTPASAGSDTPRMWLASSHSASMAEFVSTIPTQKPSCVCWLSSHSVAESRTGLTLCSTVSGGANEGDPVGMKCTPPLDGLDSCADVPGVSTDDAGSSMHLILFPVSLSRRGPDEMRGWQVDHASAAWSLLWPTRRLRRRQIAKSQLQTQSRIKVFKYLGPSSQGARLLTRVAGTTGAIALGGSKVTIQPREEWRACRSSSMRSRAGIQTAWLQMA